MMPVRASFCNDPARHGPREHRQSERADDDVFEPQPGVKVERPQRSEDERPKWDAGEDWRMLDLDPAAVVKPCAHLRRRGSLPAVRGLALPHLGARTDGCDGSAT